MPDLVENLYDTYSFTDVAEPMLRRKLSAWKIGPGHLAYQECWEAAMFGYMYSIARCALCGYKNVEGYIWRMMSVSIILALGSMDDAKQICVENGFQRVWLNQPELKNRY